MASAPEQAIIQLNDLTKIYKGKFRKPARKAVVRLNLAIAPGEIFGFLGPNGAGKTTTIKLILGLLFPTSGTVLLFNRPPGQRQAKYRVGFLPEVAYYYRYLKAEELLDAYGKLFRLSKKARVQKIESLLTLVGLTDAADIYLREYSKGMLQRFGLAQALINDPELLILDEPTSGLDPIARKEIRDIILQLHQQGKTIFFSSHELTQVEMVCTRVAILHQGKLVREGKLSELLSAAGKTRIEIGDTVTEFSVQLKSLSENIEYDARSGTIWLADKTNLFPLLHLLESEKIELVSINPERETLEDLFVKTVRSPQS
ncbi:MAG: ABC transporter ATP-binding protein [bacterium]|nr:ABC transporter ATP-binding protein [bacterium]